MTGAAADMLGLKWFGGEIEALPGLRVAEEWKTLPREDFILEDGDDRKLNLRVG